MRYVRPNITGYWMWYTNTFNTIYAESLPTGAFVFNGTLASRSSIGMSREPYRGYERLGIDASKSNAGYSGSNLQVRSLRTMAAVKF